MTIRDEISQCSTAANRIVLWCSILEGLIWIGVWLTRWQCLRWAGGAVAACMIVSFVAVSIEFRALQIAQASMTEMQEYIDKRIEEQESEKILHE